MGSQQPVGGRPRNFRLTGRSLARNQALQILFQAEACNRSAEDVLSGEFVLGFDAASDDDNTLPAGPLDPYAEYLALGVDEYRHELDEVISSASENWSISRMSAVDRNLLRVAVFEMRESTEVEPSVAISEAVELAKSYGTDESSAESAKFVNGVLGRIAADMGVPYVPAEVRAYEEGFSSDEANAPDAAEPKE